MRSAHITKTGLAVLLGALALLSTGCISIKSGETVVTQRAPGVATLGATMCISDYNQSHYPDCNRGNIQETDNGCHPGDPGGGFCFADGDELSSPVSAQV